MPGLPIRIDDLINARSIESSRIEFKATWDEYVLDACSRTICAFANDLLNLNGGYLIIGIADDKGIAVLPPRGLDAFNIEEIQKSIRGQCKRFDPEYQPLIFPEYYQDKLILIIWAPGGDNRPHQSPKSSKSSERAYFVRQASETIEAKGEILRQLLERTARIPFDDRRNSQASLVDISPALVIQFLKDIGSDLVVPQQKYADEEIYRHMRLVVQINAHNVPRNCGLLFFNPDPQKFFEGARIDLVQFADDAGGNLIEERKIVGPLPQQITLALDYLNSLGDIKLKKVPGRAEVERTVAYPYEAMEEAIVNAIYHRSYDSNPEPTKIYFYPDRLEIISYPGPVHGIDFEHLNSGKPLPPVPARNRRIGEFLKELRLAEMRGTGIPKIRRTMMENGSPQPRFEFDEARTYFRVILPVHPRYKVIHALREGAHFWAIGDSQGALSHLLRTFEQQPGSGAIAGQIIEYAASMDMLDLMSQTFDRFVKESHKSDVVQPYLKITKAYLDKNRIIEARKILEQIPPTSSFNETVEAAILSKRANDYKTAHSLFRSAYEELKDDARVVHEFAQTKMFLAGSARDFSVKKRLNNEALELLHRVTNLTDEPTRLAWCWADIARTLQYLKKPATQIETAYLKAVSLLPSEPRFKAWHQEWKSRSARSKVN